MGKSGINEGTGACSHDELRNYTFENRSGGYQCMYVRSDPSLASSSEPCRLKNGSNHSSPFVNAVRVPLLSRGEEFYWQRGLNPSTQENHCSSFTIHSQNQTDFSPGVPDE